MSDVTIMLPNRGIRNAQLKDAGTAGLEVLAAETEADVQAAAGIVAASTSVAGKVELATSAETATGTATDLAVTPEGAADTFLPLAGGTVTGPLEIGAAGSLSFERPTVPHHGIYRW